MNAEEYIISQRSFLKEKNHPNDLIKNKETKVLTHVRVFGEVCSRYLPLGTSPLPDHSFESPGNWKGQQQPQCALGAPSAGTVLGLRWPQSPIFCKLCNMWWVLEDPKSDWNFQH